MPRPIKSMRRLFKDYNKNSIQCCNLHHPESYDSISAKRHSWLELKASSCPWKYLHAKMTNRNRCQWFKKCDFENKHPLDKHRIKNAKNLTFVAAFNRKKQVVSNRLVFVKPSNPVWWTPTRYGHLIITDSLLFPWRTKALDFFLNSTP